jgi:putative hydrolase
MRLLKKLREIALLLESQHANPFRSCAYLNAANTLDNLNQDVRDLLDDEGLKGLIELPGIGEGIARSIYEYVAIGRMSRLKSLQGGIRPDPSVSIHSHDRSSLCRAHL